MLCKKCPWTKCYVLSNNFTYRIVQGRIVKEFDLFNSQKKNESSENSAIQAQIAHLVGEMIGIKKTLQDFIKDQQPLHSLKS